MREDKPLVAPSLLELSACVIAKDDGRYLFFKEQCMVNPSPSETSFFLSQSDSVDSQVVGGKNTVELPVNCAETVFNCVRSNLKQYEPNGEAEQADVDASVPTFAALCPFFNGIHCPISKLDLSNLYISDRILAGLLNGQQHTLTCLDLSYVQGISSAGVCSTLYNSDVYLSKLRSLKLTSTDLLRVPKFRRSYCSSITRLRGSNGRSIDTMLSSLPVVSEDDLSDNALNQSASGGRSGALAFRKSSQSDQMVVDEYVPHFMKFCPNIEHLYFLQGLSYNIEDEQQDAFLTRVLECAKSNIRTLDLSEWQNVRLFLYALTPIHLTTLVLYDVQFLETSIVIIKDIKTLVSLDLSQSERSTGQYTRPVTALHSLVVNLSRLQYLDISGTNLIAACSDDDRPFKGTGLISSDIAGLRYLRRRLKYLGIFNCDNASHFQNIPAEKVCGDHGENQIILALEVYMERPKMMQAVLNESYQLYRFSSSLVRHVEALHLVLKALALHQTNSNLQIAGSASMFYIIRNVRMNRDTKRSVIHALVNGMENHLEEQVMVRNCCLSLCQFEIPQEILFNYGRVATLLVRVLELHNTDQLTQRIVVFLLNSMACHVEGDQKIEVGNIGAIEIILEQIRRKHSAGTCDDVMEVGWSFLWNITDETPSNCDRFLNAKGLELFQMCYSQFPNETELVRNMMGLIGNIAEVEHLRHQLMDPSNLSIFCLLDSLSDGIEISYNSAGVLAHLVSDGEELWKLRVNISRDFVMKEIIRATEAWDLTARRYINYRSFKPILKLLPMFDSSGSQHWAVWALANLTSTDRQKYCRYVQDEGGEELLQQVSVDARTPPRVRELANLVLSNIEKWKKTCAEQNIPEAGDMEMVE